MCIYIYTLKNKFILGKQNFVLTTNTGKSNTLYIFMHYKKIDSLSLFKGDSVSHDIVCLPTASEEIQEGAMAR